MTPFFLGDIGKGMNDFISFLPDDSWICLRDSDTLFLTSQQQMQIQSIVDSNPEYDLIGCKTNRLKSTYQAIHEYFEEDSIQKHIELAKRLEEENYGIIEEVPANEVLAGIFLLFRKCLWNQFKFPEKTIQFDIEYTKTLREAGKKLGMAKGIYILHLYRYGSKDPYQSINHILHCHNF